MLRQIIKEYYISPDTRLPLMHHTGTLTKLEDMIALNTSYEGTDGNRYSLDLRVFGEREFPLKQNDWLERALQLHPL